MDVTDYCHRRLDVDNIALLHQQLLRLGAYCFDHGVGEELLSIQACDALIEVDAGCTRFISHGGEVWRAWYTYQEGQALRSGDEVMRTMEITIVGCVESDLSEWREAKAP